MRRSIFYHKGDSRSPRSASKAVNQSIKEATASKEALVKDELQKQRMKQKTEWEGRCKKHEEMHNLNNKQQEYEDMCKKAKEDAKIAATGFVCERV